MKKLALIVLLFAGCASSIPIRMPECWEIVGTKGMGSSVPFLQKGKKLWLFTAKHNLPLSTANGLKVIDQISHPTRDVALISVEGTARIIPIANKDAVLGDKLYAAGFQLDALLITSGYQGSKPGRMSCPIWYGSSGGPVWNNDVELVGIVKALWRMQLPRSGDIYSIPHISIYASVVDLKEWINENIK